MTIDILKVPHHGNYNAKLPALFSAVAMDYAVITCSEKNPAERETGCQVFCTKDGNVRIISTESGIKIQQ